ncbi:MAG: O-antigen ligase family protein, partial [Chloroflexi bacterium]|nr:O-antigen ligase family protein [Chloroflexota bacterium]
MNARLQSAYQSTVNALWLALLVLIPVTSFPPLVELVGGTPVAPLSLVPLGGLMAIWLIPALLRGRKIPPLVVPFLVFACIAVLSAAVGLWRGILPVRGVSVIGREARALLTLGIALGFYLCAALLPAEQRRIRPALRAIYIGAIATLLWSTVQAAFVMTGGEQVPQAFVNLHRIFSPRDPVNDRLTGLAFEPSWLGDQLVTLYLPLWLAAIITRTSGWSSGPRAWWIEAALAVWGLLVLALTRSRISYLSLAMMLGILGLIAAWKGAGWLLRRWARGSAPVRGGASLGVRAAMVFVFLAVCAGGLYGAARVYSRVDPRMVRLFQTVDRLPEVRAHYPNEVLYELANRVAFAERIAYWEAGLRTFSAHPVLGVGFGNSGFFMQANLPGYSYRLTEIRDLISGEFAGLPNPKNLWIRLLAETGMLG